MADPSERMSFLHGVIPTSRGSSDRQDPCGCWIPAFAGMTGRSSLSSSEAKQIQGGWHADVAAGSPRLRLTMTEWQRITVSFRHGGTAAAPEHSACTFNTADQGDGLGSG